MSNLNFGSYVGGKGTLVDRSGLALVPTPDPEGRWMPIPHFALVEQLDKSLATRNMKIASETYKLDKNGTRMFAMIQVTNCVPTEDFGFAIGLRNAHDKMLRAGLAVGMGVFVCSNLSFNGEIVIGRKHTKQIMNDLPGLMDGAIERLGLKWSVQGETVKAYKETGISKQQGHDLLIECARQEVFPRTKLMDVIEEWESPRHPEFKDRNLWALFNAVTENLKPREKSTGSTLWILPERTRKLHQLFDPVAGIMDVSVETVESE